MLLQQLITRNQVFIKEIIDLIATGATKSEELEEIFELVAATATIAKMQQ